jgi:hypothetical protein
MNDKSGLDLQSLINIVHTYQHDASKSVEKERLLKYLITSFDRYVSSTHNKNDYDKFSEDELEELGETLHKRNHANENVINIHQDFDDEIKPYDGGKKSRFRKFLKTFRQSFRICCITKGKRYGNFLLVLFIFVKILYTINSISQLFLLNQFLGNDYLILGIEIITKIWHGDDWSQIKRFPRVTLCDFRIREVGIVHRYTVQCVLSINLFNEKIFIFLWYWLCFISIFNILDLISWSYTLLINSHERYMYVKRRLLNTSLLNATKQQRVPLLTYKNKKTFHKFVNNYLKEDGVLALRLLSRNSHDLIVTEVIAKLYDLYLIRQREKVVSSDEESARPQASTTAKNRNNNNNNESGQFPTVLENLERK